MSTRNFVAEITGLFCQILGDFIVSLCRLFVPVKPKSVKGETVLITGGNRGIGKELSLLYGSLGATVVIWNRDPKSAQEVVEEIASLGYPEAHAYTCDVSNREEVLKLAQKVRREVGNVTILVNNSGMMPQRSFLDQTQEDIEETYRVNVSAHFWTIQAFLPDMIRNNHGHIVSIGSIAGVYGLGNASAYAASKFAIRGMSYSLQQELQSNPKNQIKITDCYPFFVDTGFCKVPQIRFRKLFPMVTPQAAAQAVVDAQRREYQEISIPQSLLRVHVFTSLLPKKVVQKIWIFLGIGIEPAPQ